MWFALCREFESGRQDLNLRPPAPSRKVLVAWGRIRLSSAGWSCSELGSVALNLDPGLDPVGRGRGTGHLAVAGDVGRAPYRCASASADDGCSPSPPSATGRQEPGAPAGRAPAGLCDRRADGDPYGGAISVASRAMDSCTRGRQAAPVELADDAGDAELSVAVEDLLGELLGRAGQQRAAAAAGGVERRAVSAVTRRARTSPRAVAAPLRSASPVPRWP